jgi:tRNA nucleotidyltransferase/poly(A) polymerase
MTNRTITLRMSLEEAQEVLFLLKERNWKPGFEEMAQYLAAQILIHESDRG